MVSVHRCIIHTIHIFCTSSILFKSIHHIDIWNSFCATNIFTNQTPKHPIVFAFDDYLYIFAQKMFLGSQQIASTDQSIFFCFLVYIFHL